MLNTPSNSNRSEDDPDDDFRSPIVDSGRDQVVERLQFGRHELDLAEIEIAKQKRIDNVEMARNLFAEINTKETKRAWSSLASSSGHQEVPEQLTNDQMDMANRQAFQQTAERASMSVAAAVSQMNKRADNTNQPASSSGAGLGRGAETTSPTIGRPRTRSRPAPGTDDTSNPVGRPKGKAKAKAKARD